MKRVLAILLCITFFCSMPPKIAHAGVSIHITDVGLLKYQTASDGKIYLRNLDHFDSSALGCCYSYYIDTATAEGKKIFVLLLAAAAQRQGLWMAVPTSYAAGAVTTAGNW